MSARVIHTGAIAMPQNNNKKITIKFFSRESRLAVLLCIVRRACVIGITGDLVALWLKMADDKVLAVRDHIRN